MWGVLLLRRVCSAGRGQLADNSSDLLLQHTDALLEASFSIHSSYSFDVHVEFLGHCIVVEGLVFGIIFQCAVLAYWPGSS